MWGVATALAMGLVATYAVVFACCTLCAKWKPHPLLVAMGYLSNLRIFAALIAVVLTLGGARVNAVCDECWLERITGIPLAVLALPGVISLVGAAIWLWRYFPRDHRRVAVGAMCLGIAMGLAFYAGFLGPLVLPFAGGIQRLTWAWGAQKEVTPWQCGRGARPPMFCLTMAGCTPGR